MPRAATRDPIYRRRRYSAEVIEQCVRWYITYRLSYRDLVAMMAERGIAISHTTIMRWVLRYIPEFERRRARFSRPTGQCWRMDETEVVLRGQPHWLYRAVDRNGKSIHSLLCENRTIESAKAFFQSAVARPEVFWPATVNLDGNTAVNLLPAVKALLRHPMDPAQLLHGCAHFSLLQNPCDLLNRKPLPLHDKTSVR